MLDCTREQYATSMCVLVWVCAYVGVCLCGCVLVWVGDYVGVCLCGCVLVWVGVWVDGGEGDCLLVVCIEMVADGIQSNVIS